LRVHNIEWKIAFVFVTAGNEIKRRKMAGSGFQEIVRRGMRKISRTIITTFTPSVA
jgi:hypothetical protein